MTGTPCEYCGEFVSGIELFRGYVVPKSRGGEDVEDNRIDCCRGCGCTKNGRTLIEARPDLIQRKIGWPKFSKSQIAFLRDRGFGMTEFDDAKLHFELTPAKAKKWMPEHEGKKP